MPVTVACGHDRRRCRSPRARSRARPRGGARRSARSSPLRPRRLDGRGRLRARGTSHDRPTRYRRACVRPQRTACRSCPAAAAPGSRARPRRSATRSSSSTAKMTGIVEVRPEDRLAWVEPGVPNLDLANAPAPARVHLRAGPLEPADLVDRRQREHERGRAALPRLRGHVRARAGARRRDGRRHPGAPRRRGTRGGRVRPARRRGGQRGHARHRRHAACVRLMPLPPAVRTMLFGLRHRGSLRGHGLVDHRARRRARCRRDDGSGHRARGRDASRTPATRSMPPRCCSSRSTACAAGVAAQTREVEAAAAANGASSDPRGRRRRRTRAAVEGPQVGVRRGRADRSPLPPARLRGAAHEARRGAARRLRDRRAPRPHRDERVPRRRRQPAPAVLVRSARCRERSSACCRRATRSCACASMPAGP